MHVAVFICILASLAKDWDVQTVGVFLLITQQFVFVSHLDLGLKNCFLQPSHCLVLLTAIEQGINLSKKWVWSQYNDCHV